MSEYLIRKLEQFTKLSDDDKRVLRDLAVDVRRLEPREDVIREGERPAHVHLILEGWACRYKLLEDGRRQIESFLLPGDLCDMRMFILKRMDHSIGAISPLAVAQIPADMILAAVDGHARIARALWWNSLVEESIAREWTTNVGARTAFERLAHLFCELFIRLRCVGLTDATTCEVPLTQEQLGDATGLSTVHVNRTMQELRAANLIEFRGKQLTIHKLPALQDAGLFTANYLHLDRDGEGMDANDV